MSYVNDKRKIGYNQYCRKTFPSSPLTFLFFFIISLVGIFFFALINSPSSSCNDCHKTAYLNYLTYMKHCSALWAAVDEILESNSTTL